MRIARFAAALLALGLAGCSSYNPLVWLGIKNEPANKPTPLAPINETVKPRAAWSAFSSMCERLAGFPGTLRKTVKR